jgi:hypothetical protein
MMKVSQATGFLSSGWMVYRLSESSIGVSRETLQRLKEAKPALAAFWAKSGKLLRSDDDAINALMDHFFTV